MTAKKPPLRERKYAQTKLSLLGAAIEAMESQTLADIAVKSLCEEAEVSEATFFNYFAKKSDLLDYFVQLWNLELSWHHQRSAKRGLALLEESFSRVAQRFQQHPGIMAEVISHQARSRGKPDTIELSRAERLRAYPQLEGICEQPIEALDRMWASALQQAVTLEELPPNLHLPTVIVGLASIFYGVPLALGRAGATNIASMYKQQLNIYLAGIKQVSQR